MGNFVTFPVQRVPLCFEKHDEYSATGKREYVSDEAEEKKALNGFEELTESFFREMLEERHEITLAKNKFHDVDMTTIKGKFPHWSFDDIMDIKAQFQTFDVNQDGLIDFVELCSVLDEIGDTSDDETRSKYFDEMDEDGSGAIDFEEYLDLINMVTQKQGNTNTLTQICQEGAENAQKVRRLSIVQQINNGLF